MFVSSPPQFNVQPHDVLSYYKQLISGFWRVGKFLSCSCRRRLSNSLSGCLSVTHGVHCVESSQPISNDGCSEVVYWFTGPLDRHGIRTVK